MLLFAARKLKNDHAPVMEDHFYGTISEDTNEVILQYPLLAIDKDARGESGR